MKAARYHIKRNAMIVEDIPIPEPGANEVLLRVAYCGICGSDLTRYRQLKNPPEAMRKMFGDISPVQGHEICGVVERLGAKVPARWDDGAPIEGSAVLVHPQLGCEACTACRSGYWGGCTSPDDVALIGVQRNGGLAEYVVVPFEHLIRLARGDDASMQRCALAEPLAVALRMLHASQALENREKKSAAIIGDGAIGILLAALLERENPGQILLIGRHEAKMEMVREMGAGNLLFEKELSPDLRGSFARVFQTAGSQAAFELGLDLLGHGGRMICIGYLYAGKGLDTVAFNAMIRNEKTLTGVYSYSMSEMKEAVRLIEEKILDVAPMIGRVVPLADCVRCGFEPLVAGDPQPGKVLVRCSGE